MPTQPTVARPAHSRARRVAVVVTALLLGLVPLSALVQRAAQRQAWPHLADDAGVTPVSGLSWLTQLRVTLSQTSLGRGAGRYGPSDRPAPVAPASLGVRPRVTLTGADIYRFNCQACHGQEGKGSLPEIKSVVDPVRGVPLEVMRKQLEAQHQPPGDAEARLKPERVRSDILARVHKGGQRMPAREHLRDAELSLLYTYLTQLAGKSAAAPKSEVVGWARLGEHVVKGTCHICHDAVGARPSDAAMVQGKIPSLQSLLVSQSVAEFVTKARSGAPVQMSGLATMHRGRMPVFFYLHDEEIAAAYVYLATYPPQASAGR